LSQESEVAESLRLLEKDWSVDPLLRDFILGRILNVNDTTVVRDEVKFHIPYMPDAKKYVLWKCFWPDCHNCCERQGRLPLTDDDLITIGEGLKYAKVSDFIRKETVTATYASGGPDGTEAVMTTINLKRREDESEDEDGTRIPCRFLDVDGGCSMHPARPGVCYLYPFTTWTQNDGGAARIHATYQFTGDCPGFYLADGIDDMEREFADYSVIIRDYNIASTRTNRQSFGVATLGYRRLEGEEDKGR